MNIGLIITHSVMVVLFILLGILFSRGKASFLIAGYNTMNKNEKAEYDEKALCRFMSKIMFALSFCVGIWLLSDIFDILWILFAGIAAFLAAAAFAVIYANTNNRFKR